MSCPWTSRQNKQHLVTKADHTLAELQADTGGCSLFIRRHVVLTRMWSAFVTRSMQMSFPGPQHPTPPNPPQPPSTCSFRRHKPTVAVLRTEDRATERQGKRKRPELTRLAQRHFSRNTPQRMQLQTTLLPKKQKQILKQDCMLFKVQELKEF